MQQTMPDPARRVLCFFIDQEVVCPRCAREHETYDNVITVADFERHRGDYIIYCDRCDALLAE